MQVTIDGPAGVGKTSVGKEIAKKFSLLFIQSGKLYRALAYGEVNDLEKESLSFRPTDNYEPELKMGDKILSEELYTEEISEAASKLAKEKNVRELINGRINDIAKKNDVLVEGRDIGTEVLPNAEVKIYLTASTKERARRRKAQLQTDRSLKEIETGIKERDNRDQTRKIAPLTPAEDAEIIDTTSMTEREVVDQISRIIIDRTTKPET
ncbi:MAG: (d)CMP kinase [Candidatus Bipolaricaulia bacterium]